MARAGVRHYSERLDRADLRRLMDGMADLIVELDAAGMVVDLTSGGAVGGAEWVGRAFADVVCPDSREKARDLAATDPLDEGEGLGPWGTARHVNVTGAGGESLPFLLRPFRLPPAGGVLLVGHDLAAESRMQRQFEAAQRVMIRDYEARLAQVQESYQRDLRASSVAEAAGRVGISPLEQILSDFARRLRRHCAQEALARSGEDYRAAAELLGISTDELDAILTAPPAD